MKEIWKDIKGYEGLYQVSNLGRVKSLGKGGFNQYQKNVRFLSICKNSEGYGIVVLTKELQTRTFSVHRIVAKTFIENPLNKRVVNHKDGNKLNNVASNLEWLTYKENYIHARDVLGCFSNPAKPWLGVKGGDNPCSKIVYGYSKDGSLLYKFKSVIETKLKGFTPSLVAGCARGERSHHKNIIWKYV